MPCVTAILHDMRRKPPLKSDKQKPKTSRRFTLDDRLAVSPTEFAKLFGHHPVWGYRQIYEGRIKVLSECGRLLIPRAEIDAFLARVGTYNGKAGKAPELQTPSTSPGLTRK